jgi:hypothetical protein
MSKKMYSDARLARSDRELNGFIFFGYAGHEE